MTRFPFAYRPVGLAIVFVIAGATACGDGILHPGTAAGYYRLVSVNGQPLPYFPPSLGLSVSVWRGDLVLRPNGTFSSGIGGNLQFGMVVEGTYRVSNDELVLHAQGAPSGAEVVGDRSTDSIVLRYPDFSDGLLTLTYRRAQLAPSTVPSDLYRLRSINGRTQEPLIAYDTTFGNRRYVFSVGFDSVTFSDGVFFRRHRSETAIGYLDGQVSTVDSSEWTTWGVYESGPGRVILLHYRAPTVSTPERDSLSIAGDTLVRRTSLVTGVQVERYVPLR